MQFAQRQRLALGKWRPVAAAIGLGLLLGFLGPFGSNAAYPTATRYAFWLGLTAAGVVAAVAADAVLPEKRLRAGALRIGTLALLSALPMTFVVAWTIIALETEDHYLRVHAAGGSALILMRMATRSPCWTHGWVRRFTAAGGSPRSPWSPWRRTVNGSGCGSAMI